MKKLLVLMGMFCVVALTACSSREFVKGDYAKDVDDPNLLTDKWSESDMQQAVKDLVASATQHPAINLAKRPPIVMVTRLQNKTSEHIDTRKV